MRNRLERRRLTLRAAALCIVLVLLCGCLLPAFAEGAASDSVPGQTLTEEEADEPALDEEDEADESEEIDEPVTLPAVEEKPVAGVELDVPEELEETKTPDEYFETTYLFWLSEADEEDGGLPYAEQTVGSGSELLLPEEPEAEGKTFRYWYSRDEEGAAVRFTSAEGPLWPEADGECSLYAYFTADTQQEEPVLDDEETPALTEPEEEVPADEPEQTEDIVSDECGLLDEAGDENALPADEEDDLDLLARYPTYEDEDAAVFLLKTPTSKPGSNDPSQWAPDNSLCKWIGEVNVTGATWDRAWKNIVTNVSDYVVSWPDESTGAVWTLKPGDDLWNDVVNEIWDEYKDTIEAQTGITGLTKGDLESIIVTPYKISQSNGTTPDKHIDCTISVKSKKSFTARFNVRAPGADNYTNVDSQEYRTGERVAKTNVKVQENIDIGGVLYVFDGWYREDSGPVTDEPGKTLVTQDEWDEGYEPTDEELENGVVNFYAHYVLADIDPDTGVETGFSALPLLLCAGAAAVGCTKRKKEEDE